MRREQVHSCGQVANRVRRYHTWPVLHQQTTGEHANRVLQIYVELFGVPRGEVLYYISTHDAGEQYAGDCQYGAKRAVPELKVGLDKAEKIGYQNLGITQPELTQQEWKQFKLCDLLEMWEFAWVEYCMGNSYAIPVFDGTHDAATKLAAECSCDELVYRWLEKSRAKRRKV
jgi:5'-deoxynucleotidase YfbR-like HD superfamily hydrolase